jgi:hypothetical protein
MKDKTAEGLALGIFIVSLIACLAVSAAMVWGIVELVSWVVTK